MMKSRKITNTGTLKNIGKFPSLKMRKTIWFESHLERDFIYLIEFDQSIICYREQPFKIRYLLDGKERKYFPDFLIERRNERQIVEIKPQSKIENDEFIKFSNTMTNHLARKGFEYIVCTDLFIRVQPRLANIKLLWRYARIPINTQCQIFVRELFSQLSEISFFELCSFLVKAKFQKEIIYTLLFHKYLLVDIEKPITSDSVIFSGNFK